jgi:hypothetical protein
MVKSNISVLTYGIILILFIVIVIIIIFSSKCTKRESFRNKKILDDAKSSCEEDEIELCSMYAGSDVACGCLKNKGGSNDKYKKTNNIACGNDSNYVCNYTKYKKTSPKLSCGCMKVYEKDYLSNIIPEEYIN